MKALNPTLLALGCALLLSACDAVTGPTVDETAAYPHRSLTSSLSPGEVGVALCERVSGESGAYERVVVAPEEVAARLARGDRRAGTARLGGDCRTVEVPAASCPCFTASDLGTPFGGSAPSPYLFFDVYNYYSEDERRTEARVTLQAPEGTFEEVAAVYITSTGDPAAPLAPLCFRQDVGPDVVTGEPAYFYETLGLTIAQAEACRATLAAFASDAGADCEGGACGVPYTEDHLDPTFGPYHDEGFRTPAPLLDILEERIEAVRQRLTLPA